MSEEKAHSELGASSSERWLNCPGSVRLIRKAPPIPEREAAKRGTKAHGYLEDWLKKILKYPESNWRSLIPRGLAEDKELFMNVIEAIKHIENIYDPKIHELLTEEKLSLEYLIPESFGTTDIRILEDFILLQIWDYKNGKWAVELKKEVNGKKIPNTQLLFYGLAAAKKINFEALKIRLGIIQPQAYKKPISIDLTMKELRQYEEMFRVGALRTQEKKAPLVVGSWCHFCAAKDFNCPKQEKLRDTSGKDETLFADCE